MKSKAWEDSWLKFLDWSQMENTFKKLSVEKKGLVIRKGYWSLGKLKFV